MTRKSFVFCVILFCLFAEMAICEGAGYIFIDFPPVKGKFREVTACSISGEMGGTTYGIIDANGYIIEVKSKSGDTLITINTFTYTSTGKIKEKLGYYKGEVLEKEFYSYDNKDRLAEVRYSDATLTKDLVLKNITTYAYEGDTLKASFKKTDAAGINITAKGTAAFDQAGRKTEETIEYKDDKTKEWKVGITMTAVYDKKGYQIEYHYKSKWWSVDTWTVITFDKATGFPLKFTDYSDKEKTRLADSYTEFTYK